ncbi:hypothetical protein [Streptomyces sp. Qhu_M48]|uniref:hypothetical protein n=1 Tax=Streptomyces sp. Qhu_M48 TaxID=3435889 RepID=UPI003F4FCF15
MVSKNLVSHPVLNSDAKILLMHVQGLPEDAPEKPLHQHAIDLGMKLRAYQRAKGFLISCGLLHEWKAQCERGYWTTTQLLSNVTLTREEAVAIRDRVPAAGEPTSGFPTARTIGHLPPTDEDDGGKTSSHPPTKARAPKSRRSPQPPPAPEADPAQEPRPTQPPAPAQEPQLSQEPQPAPDSQPLPEPQPAPEPEAVDAEGRAPEVALAERLLLSLRHRNRDLLLGVREARGLAEAAAEWLRRGVSAADLLHALSAHLPRDGVRSAAGFLRHRLVAKLPPAVSEPLPVTLSATEAPGPAAGAPAAPGPKPLITCDGPGNTHVFRPTGEETFCGPCRTEEAWKAHERRFQPRPAAPFTPWRDRVDKVVQERLG